jgi:hypothetical protein
MSASPREHLLSASLIDIAVESWRFLRTMERVALLLDADQQKRVVSRFHYFQKRIIDTLESAGLKLVALDGSQFGPGLAATAVNAGDFEPGDHLEVDQTLEPVVMGTDGVIRTGTVTLRKVTL